ncbi:MAG TPA: hypothetical protein VKV03_09060 [Candidatus Binataceae bacterium]|nr:hypothetical protein [Candidatus Binataceae bacterium]
MNPRYLILSAAIAFVASGCFFSSQPVGDSALGTNCKAVTSGLMFLSKPDVTCDQPAQPPAPSAAPATAPAPQ